MKTAPYIDPEPKKYNIIKRKRSKMFKEKTTEKTSKKYNKTQGEHYKDIVIAILITGVIAFVGGITFANNQQAQIDHAVQAAQIVKK